MKIYKIYAKGCTNPNPIKDVTYMEKEMVEDAISENWDNATENGSVEFETDLDGDISQEDYEKRFQISIANYKIAGKNRNLIMRILGVTPIRRWWISTET